MWDVCEKNIISIGVAFSKLSIKVGTQSKTIESKSISDFFKNYDLIADKLNAIIIQFDDWTPELIQLLNFTKKNENIHVIILFETSEEFQIHFSKMNTSIVVGIVDNNLRSEKIERVLQSIGIISDLPLRMQLQNIVQPTRIELPLSLQAISKNQLIIEKPSFTKEIETTELEIAFKNLQLNVNSLENKVHFSDNKIFISGDFTEIINKLKTVQIKSIPLIKVAILTKNITEEIQSLYGLPNVSLSLYRNPKDLDDDVDLIIINEVYIDNNPFSAEILQKCKLNMQKVVVFNAQSSSRAYQKVYRYKKILLSDSSFSVDAIISFIEMLQQDTKSEFYYIDEWDTIGQGQMSFNGEIVMINEVDYQLQIPFKLPKTTILKTSFWNEITGDIIESQKEGICHSHIVRFNNLSELRANQLRVFINQMIYYQTHFKEELALSNFEDFNLPEPEPESA